MQTKIQLDRDKGRKGLPSWTGHPSPGVSSSSSISDVILGKSPYFSGFHFPHLKGSIILSCSDSEKNELLVCVFMWNQKRFVSHLINNRDHWTLALPVASWWDQVTSLNSARWQYWHKDKGDWGSVLSPELPAHWGSARISQASCLSWAFPRNVTK